MAVNKFKALWSFKADGLFNNKEFVNTLKVIINETSNKTKKYISHQ